MKRQWAVVGALLLALAAGVGTGAGAGESKTFALMGQKDSPKASGTATIEGTKLAVTATGLRPNGVYTVWFVNMQPTMTKPARGPRPTPSRRTHGGTRGTRLI